MYTLNPSYFEDKNVYPLRIYIDSGIPRLVCPRQFTHDEVTAQHLDHDSRIVHLEAVSYPGDVVLPGFKRHFFLSTSGDEHKITTTGYLFNGLVDVAHWKARHFPNAVTDSERPDVEMLDQIEMFHVVGDAGSVTGGKRRAANVHKYRIQDMDLIPISVDEGMKVFDAMREHAPIC